jgi:predicted Zn-dependent protease
MLRDLSLAIVSIWLFTHAVDFWNHLNNPNADRQEYFPIKNYKKDEKIIHTKPVLQDDGNTNKTDYLSSLDTNEEPINIESLRKIENERAKRTIVIMPLGEKEETALEIASESIKSFFGFETVIIKKSREVTQEMFSRDSLDADKVLDIIKGTQYRTVYVTKYPMTTDNRCEALGYTSYGGTVILVNSSTGIEHTSLHEICHTYGLMHCSKRDCLMYKSYTGVKRGLCENCSSILRGKLPNFKP